MNFKPALVAAFVAILSLSACGGGGGSGSNTPTVPVESPATLTQTDTVVGTGATLVTGGKARVKYSGYLYSSSATGNKGAHFQTGEIDIVLGTTNLIAGFTQGVAGMKVGGKRTVIIPSSMAYGASGTTGIPGNSGVVFDLELVSVG
jgi:FKBP-type peptidyl-prolyl cis-trans isomerase FkpA